MKPIVFDLYSGLGGWSEAFIAEGFRTIGFDIEAHNYGNGGYPGELVLCDVRSLSGAELVKTYGVPACIVASPPCTEFSYLAMPWSRGKKIMKALNGNGEFPAGYKGSRTVEELNDLFNQCFRIQREVSEAAGHHVPMIVENVRGAQRWVGRSKANFGSFHFWADVPALMPIPAKLKIKTIGPISSVQTQNYNCHINEMRDAIKGEGNKTAGMNWSDQTKRGQDFTRIAAAQRDSGVKVPSENGHRTEVGKGARFTSRDCEGTKQRGSGREWFAGEGKISRMYSSKSKKRKQSSAEIAKIPYALASWIARVFKPKD